MGTVIGTSLADEDVAGPREREIVLGDMMWLVELVQAV